MAPRINQPSTHTLEEEPQQLYHQLGEYHLPETQINILYNIYPCPVSEGPKGSHLGGVWKERPCHTGAQCGASPTRAGHGRAVQSYTGATSRGRGQPPQHQLPLNGSDGQRRSGEAAQLPQPSVASLPRILCQGTRSPGAQGPMLQEEMGEGIMPRRPGGGGYLYGLFQALRGPAVGPPPSPSSQPLQPASPRTPPPAEAAAPGLRSPGRRGRVGLACDTVEVVGLCFCLGMETLKRIQVFL